MKLTDWLNIGGFCDNELKEKFGKNDALANLVHCLGAWCVCLCFEQNVGKIFGGGQKCGLLVVARSDVEWMKRRQTIFGSLMIT